MAEPEIIENQVIITNINVETYTPLGITPAEVIANALRESGLIIDQTRIDDQEPVELCSAYLEKKSNFQQLTKLGNILVKNGVVTLSELKEALAEQTANPRKKLGNILIEMGFCTKYEIEHCIQSQNKIRDDIQKLSEYEDKISSIRNRINTGRSARERIE